MDVATTTSTGAELMSWISVYGYFILLPLFIIEGPVVGITSGVLVSLGVLHPLPVFLLYTIGTIITDTAVYYLARSGNAYVNKTALGRQVIGRAEAAIGQADSDWRKKFSENYFSLMLLAKLAPINLLATFVAVGAGMLRIPKWRFYKPILVAQPVWSAAVIGVGFYLGDVVSEAHQIALNLGIATAVFGVLFFLYRQYLHRKVMRSPLGQFFVLDK